MDGDVPGSDLGRRLRHRREERGLSLEAAATAANVDPRYLHYLETAATPDPGRGTLLRLALAFATSPAALLGGDQHVPLGHGAAQPPAELLELDDEASMRLITPGGVGRVVFDDPRGPVALPVNYTVRDGRIVFRTEASTSIATGAADHRISFEADHVDEAFSEGWSVLVTGVAHRMEDDDAAASAKAALRSWARGERESYFVLEPEVVTGRQLRREPT